MTLDATVAGAASNSYLTVAEADALAAEDMGPEAAKWLEAKTPVADREKALKRATREIGYFVRPGPTPFAPSQRLLFPRADDVDANGDPVIPAAIRDATYYQAAFVLKNQTVLARADVRHARNVSQASEQGTSYSQATGDQPSSYSPRALQALAAFEKTVRGGTMTVATNITGLGDPYAQGMLS